MDSFASDTFNQQIIAISRSDRWQAYQRFQELGVNCGNTSEGGLWVEVQDAVTLQQVRSVLQQLTCSRQELVDWLKRCWRSRA
ncbi:MAG: hypothetical protein VKJ46_12535 [Leptolyngbyaceae bacterium]|nr:hypothetical protein [Leptolyngbyaceae bacterium]